MSGRPDPGEGHTRPDNEHGCSAIELPEFDVANHLQDEEQIQLYLAEAARQNDAELLASAQADVARARERWGLKPGA